MLLAIAVIVVLLWLAGFTLFHVGALINLLLIVAIIALVMHFLGMGSRRRIF